MDVLTVVNELNQRGVIVQFVDEELRIKRPASWLTWEDAPEDARPLLKALKARAEEVKALLARFDENEAYRLFCEASVRASKTFSPEAWAREPELVNDILAAEQDYAMAYRLQDMPGCREAVERYEQGFHRLKEAYTQRPPDT